jgi:hypothetical protein
MARDLSMTRPIWDSNTERNDATAPKIKAGAAACDITSCSWSIVGRLDNIATSPFIDWLVSPEGQKSIGKYKIDGEQLFYANAEDPNA